MTRLGRSGRVAVAIGGLAAALSSCSTPEAAGPRRIVVVDAVAMPGGDGTVGAPWLNLDAALEQGGPGVEIHLRPGLYRGPFRTSSGGSQGAPLRIVGSQGATLVAAEDEHLLTVAHPHVEIEGLEFREADQLLVVEGAHDVGVRSNTFTEAGGECVRVKRAERVRIERNTVDRCGTRGFDLAADRKNGEGIYIGTAPEQSGGDPDRTNDVVVRGNDIRTPAECVDVKEGATGVIIEANRCRGGLDPRSGGISVRGNGVVVRDNDISDQAGAGIRLGGDEDGDGVDNEVVDNRISEVDGFGVKVERLPQRAVCDNRVDGADEGVANTSEVRPLEDC